MISNQTRNRPYHSLFDPLPIPVPRPLLYLSMPFPFQLCIRGCRPCQSWSSSRCGEGGFQVSGSPNHPSPIPNISSSNTHTRSLSRLLSFSSPPLPASSSTTNSSSTASSSFPLTGDVLGDEDEEGRLLGSRVASEWVQLSVSRTAWDTLRALMVNRNRLLGKIDRLLPSWEGLLDEAEYLDMENRQKRWQLVTAANVDKANGEPQDEAKEYCVTWIMLSTTLLMDLQM